GPVMRLLALTGLLLFPAAPVPKEKPSFEATFRKSDDSFRHVADETASYFEIVSPSGIGSALIKRKSGAWPSPLIIRFAGMQGLETFGLRIGTINLGGGMSAKSSPFRFNARGMPVKDGKEATWTVRIRVLDKAVEVTVETKTDLAEVNDLKLEWIDFFRG